MKEQHVAGDAGVLRELHEIFVGQLDAEQDEKTINKNQWKP
jgi:hypothetical protein